MSRYLAVDVGGTHIRAAIYPQDDLKPLQLVRASTREPDPNSQIISPLDKLFDLIETIWPDDQGISVISVAAPGPVNPYTGMVLEAPNIPEWKDLALRQCLEQRFNVPVLVGNDANLAALGEWTFGAGQGHSELIYLTISTGIGSGIIVNNNLLLGHSGLAAELGHVQVIPGGPKCSCGLRGHLEAVASGTAIARWIADELAKGAPSILSSHKKISARIVSEAAKQGDELSLTAFKRAGDFIGQAVASFLHIFNPSAVILGGGVSQSGALLFSPLRKSLENHVLDPRYLEDLTITSGAFGDNAGLIGALALGRSRYPHLTHKEI